MTLKKLLLVVLFASSFAFGQSPSTSINGISGPFTFTGAGVSCTGFTCTFSGGGGGGISGSSTANTLTMWTGASAVGNSPLSTTSSILSSTQPFRFNGTGPQIRPGTANGTNPYAAFTNDLWNGANPAGLNIYGTDDGAGNSFAVTLINNNLICQQFGTRSDCSTQAFNFNSFFGYSFNDSGGGVFSILPHSNSFSLSTSAPSLYTVTLPAVTGGVTFPSVASGTLGVTSGTLTSGHGIKVNTDGLTLVDSGSAAATVSSIATTSPITGGPITTTGTIGCATCVVSSSPGVGIAHFAGSTQTVTSSLVSLTADVTGLLPAANVATGTSGANIPLLSTANTWTLGQTMSAQLVLSAGANLATGQVLSWNADTGLSRSAAGTIVVGNGTAGSSTGILTASIVTAGTGTALATNTVALANNAGVFFSSTGQYGGTKDTTICRLSAGVVEVGSSTVCGISGTLRAAHIGSGSTAPTAAIGSQAASVSLDANANDLGGIATVTAVATPIAGTLFTLTFGTAYATAPHCNVDQNGGAAFFGTSWTTSTTQLVISTTVAITTGTDTFDYVCVQ